MQRVGWALELRTVGGYCAVVQEEDKKGQEQLQHRMQLAVGSWQRAVVGSWVFAGVGDWRDGERDRKKEREVSVSSCQTRLVSLSLHCSALLFCK